MTQQLWVIFSFGIYVVLFLGAVVGLGVWKAKRQRARPPVEFRFLRHPGETLRRRVAKFDEDFVFRMGAAALVPVVAAWAVFGIVLKLHPKNWPQLWIGIAATALAFAGALVAAMFWAVRGVMRYRDDRLGYAGERFVGDCLEPLKLQGWHVFHDVPGEVQGRTFNIDHVAVGPGGVWAIETKTRRKRRARPGFEPHKVFFDGRQLIWPWGEDTHGPDQAINNAAWLKQWLAKTTGIETPIRPVLAFPGWYVVDKAGAAVRAVKPEWLTDDLPKAKHILTDQQIDLIVRQLDQLCRDVED